MDPATVWLGLDCGVRVLRSAGCEANPGTPLGAVYSIIEPPRKAISIRQPKRMKPIMYAYILYIYIQYCRHRHYSNILYSILNEILIWIITVYFR